jgi:hypothetical protein
MTEKTVPFFGRCGECGHCWPVCYLPMELEKAANLMAGAMCPKGCDGRVMIPRQTNGNLQDPAG